MTIRYPMSVDFQGSELNGFVLMDGDMNTAASVTVAIYDQNFLFSTSTGHAVGSTVAPIAVEYPAVILPSDSPPYGVLLVTQNMGRNIYSVMWQN
jgi:hypothetical protein